MIGRREILAYLRGRWKTVIAVWVIGCFSEVFIVVAERILAYRFPMNGVSLLAALMLDLICLSPLKVGQASFYYTLITDSDRATVTTVFDWYRSGYLRSIRWRLRIWAMRTGLYVVLNIPTTLLLYIGNITEQHGAFTVAAVALVFSLVFLLISLVITEMILVRYIPALYLLGRTRRAFSLSKQISKGYVNEFIWVYLRFFYIPPLLYTACAVTSHQQFLRFSVQNREHHLKHARNRGRIKDNF